MQNRDEQYMQRALDLARVAEGFTSPNPMVGAVIVYNDRIIGEGYHHCAGQPHAEVNAVASVKPEDRALLSESTIYVSLEPCAHVGKTPPCADLLVEKHFKRAVIAMEDPFPQVAGRGIKRLEDAGIIVKVGVLAKEARALNCFFLTAVREQRPYITLKWSESADGFIDSIRTKECDKPFHFSDALRDKHVHRLRHLHDAILVGSHTVASDNPLLTNRLWWGRSPIRIVLDSGLRSAAPHVRLMHDASAPVLIVCSEKAPLLCELPSHVSLLRRSDSRPNDLHSLLHEFYERGIHSVLVEGGACTLQSFLDSGLYDTIDREVTAVRLRHGVPAPSLPE